MPAAFVGLRLLLEPLMLDRAPFALGFLAVLIATVIAGWRSGLLAVVFGQLLTWYAVIEPQWSFVLADSSRAWGLAVATISQLLLLLAIALYQHEVDKGLAERERRLELQDHARREIDHRIRNNLQTVIALIHLQSQRSKHEAARDALRQVAERIRAVAAVTDRLALRGDNLTSVSVRDYLSDVCEQLEQALTDGIDVRCDIPDVEAGAVEASYVGLIVNELVTNAIKYAFPDGRTGCVCIEGQVDGRDFHLTVRDNGSGIKPRDPRSGSGLGQKLVKTFVRELGGTLELSTSDAGTTHRIIVPELAASR